MFLKFEVLLNLPPVVVVTGCQWRSLEKFAICVIDTGSKFATGVIDTGSKFATSVIEYLSEFLKKFKSALKAYLGAWGKLIHEKKPGANNLETLYL
jgi:hypothetical protein